MSAWSAELLGRGQSIMEVLLQDAQAVIVMTLNENRKFMDSIDRRVRFGIWGN